MTRHFGQYALLLVVIGVGSSQAQFPGSVHGILRKEMRPEQALQGFEILIQGKPGGFVKPGGESHRGDWLRKHQNLPLTEQEKALQNDPGFRILPPQRQQRLREELRNFNNLPPQQRDRMLNRMQTWDRLSPQQQERARQLYERLRIMPPQRQQLVRRAARNLSAMDPQQQEQTLNSPAMRNGFNDNERDVMRGMLELGIAPGRQEQPDDTNADF